jgi:hypothetical protein
MADVGKGWMMEMLEAAIERVRTHQLWKWMQQDS